MRPRRYPSDTSDVEWLLLEPLLPVPACQTRRGGRPEKHHRRDIVDAIRYLPGRKRHLVVDTKGMMLAVMVTPAGQPDRDAAREMLALLRIMHPQPTVVRGDSAYAGTPVTWARRFLRLTLRIVWIVERSLAWLLNARRNTIDYERKPVHSEAHLTVAAITLMTRSLTRKRPTRTWDTNRPSAAQAA
ncbi:transposase [Actinomadura sp. DSM 109109]|nr:transposase [Actinomadura lepetitiana]